MRKSVSIWFFLCLIIFLGIAVGVVVYEHNQFDKDVISLVSRYRRPWMVSAMLGVSFFGSAGFLLPAWGILIIVLLLQKRHYDALIVLVVSLSGRIVLSGLKTFFHRQRPDLSMIPNISTFSFPSGHSFSSVVFFGVMAFIINESMPAKAYKKLLICVLLVCPLVIGISRVVLNVHYFTDVLAGFCLAFVWLELSYLFLYRKPPAA